MLAPTTPAKTSEERHINDDRSLPANTEWQQAGELTHNALPNITTAQERNKHGQREHSNTAHQSNKKIDSTTTPSDGGFESHQHKFALNLEEMTKSQQRNWSSRQNKQKKNK